MSSFSLSLEAVNAVSWGFGGFAIALTIGRFAIRWSVIRAFHADDLAHLAATIFMIAELSCYSAAIPGLYELIAWESGGPELPGAFTSVEALSAADHVFYYSSLWSVKLAFLLFYRTLFRVSRGFITAWWMVLAFNIATYFLAISAALLQCDGNPRYLTDYMVCETMSVDWARKSYIMSYIAIVSSDLATMALPLVMLRRLQMRLGQKLGVGFIFCLSFVSIAFSTLRMAESFLGGSELNILWIHLEEIVAVVVSALPSYYSLFNRRRGQSSYQATSDYELGNTRASGKWPESQNRSNIDNSMGYGTEVKISATRRPPFF